MKKTATVFALAAAFLLAPVLGVSAHSNNYDYDRDYNHDRYYNDDRFYNYPYASPVVTTQYWCGTYYSSYPCPVYPQYSYPQPYTTYPYFQTAYPSYQPYNYNQYYSQPGYYNGGAWIPYYTY
jgi:hypothetical protein